jgi:hypothetical protein
MTNWHESAPCAGADPEEWFPEDNRKAYAAKKICAACPYKTPCLTEGLTSGATHGVWGGVNLAEGVARRRARQEAGIAARIGRPTTNLADAPTRRRAPNEAFGDRGAA